MMAIAGVLCSTTECISETGEFIFQRMVALKAPSSEFFRPTVTDQTRLDPVDFHKSEKGQDSDNQPTIVELPPFHRELGRARTGMMVVVQFFPAE
jgi:hypothetical protein